MDSVNLKAAVAATLAILAILAVGEMARRPEHAAADTRRHAVHALALERRRLRGVRERNAVEDNVVARRDRAAAVTFPQQWR